MGEGLKRAFAAAKATRKSSSKLIRSAGTPRLTKRELRALAKKKAAITYPVEMLEAPPEGDESEVIVDGRVVYVKTNVPFQ